MLDPPVGSARWMFFVFFSLLALMRSGLWLTLIVTRCSPNGARPASPPSAVPRTTAIGIEHSHDNERPNQAENPSTNLGLLGPISILAVGVGTAGGAGFVPRAPGTAGAVVAVAAFAFAVQLGFSLAAHFATVFAVSLIGIWASGACEVAFGRHDDGRIVIDEVAGQWLALLPLLALSDSGLWVAGLVTGFVAFRWFDIAKPGPVGWAERRFEGGLGVMADDLVAGALAAGVVGGFVAAANASAGRGIA